MLYVTNVALSIKGSRVEKGQEIDLSPEYAARYGSDLIPVAAIPAPQAPEPEPALGEMTLEQLRAKAEEFGLTTSGSKADLVERITLHLQGVVDNEMEPHIVTQEDLDANPALVEEGVNVGDEIFLPKEQDN